MVKFEGYHVTPTANVKGILDSFRNSIPVKTGMNYLQEQATIGGDRGNFKKNPGSLGYGIYTFVDGLTEPDDLINGFAKRVMGSGEVKKVKFSINVEEDNIVDLTNSTSVQYKNFVNFCKAMEKIISQKYYQFVRQGKNQFIWDGAAIEMYIATMSKKTDTDVYGVRRDTYTPLSSDSVNASERMTSNGIEFLIRDWKIVDNITHDVLKLG